MNDMKDNYWTPPIGKYAHYCPDWDFDFIDENDMEFLTCLCFPRKVEA